MNCRYNIGELLETLFRESTKEKKNVLWRQIELKDGPSVLGSLGS